MTTLIWGVKQSFRNYVEAAGGSIAAGGGVERSADGAFVFDGAPGDGLAPGADGRPAGRGAFVGEVKFEAHGGMLAVFLADPAVEIGEGGGSLTVADTAARDYRVEVAKLDLAAATVEDGEAVIPATITLDGMRLLGDHYPPGTPLDPVRLKLG